jgi:hypothetical protein
VTAFTPAAVLIALGVALLISAAGAFYAMVKGYQVLRGLARDERDDDAILLKSPIAPGISVITAPADASAESRAWVRRLLDLHYGDHEIVVVLDGPAPMERDRWLAEFRLGLAPRKASADLKSAKIRGIYESFDPIQLVLIDKEKGGRADSWNAAVNLARFPVIGWVERFSRFQPNVLLRLIRPMLEDPEETVAVCCIAPPPAAGNRAERHATCAFLRNWLVRCAAFLSWNRLMPIPGSGVLVRRDAVLAARGFRSGMADLFLRLHAAARKARVPYRIALVTDAVVFPPEVACRKDLRRQISRDQAELRKLFFRWPLYAGWRIRLGILWYRLLLPLIETAGYPLAVAGLLLRWLDVPTALFFLVSSAGAGLVVSTAAVVLPALAANRTPEPARIKKLFFTAVLENLGYRQLRNLRLISGFFAGGE